MTIYTFTDRELLNALTSNHRNLNKERLLKRGGFPFAPERFEQLQLDNDYIMREIMNRIPSTHMWEVEKIAAGETIPSKVKPGNQYKHNIVGAVRLQVVDEYEFNGPLWTCRFHLGGKYICRIIVKQHTLLEHFTRL